MIQYDDKAGTHFIGKRIGTTQHAREAAVEEFRVDMKNADEWIKCNLVKAQFIGTIYGVDGKQVRLFGYQRIAFVLATNSDTVITIYARHKVDPTLRNPLEEIVKTQVKQANARLRQTEDHISGVIETLRTLHDQAVMEDSNGMALAIEYEIKKQERELYEARQEHARLMKGVVAYV